MSATAPPRRRRGGWILTGIAVAALVTGCGGTDRPADAVPALSAQLDRVDAAISAGRPGAARSALDDLANETELARDDGTLDAEEADAILEAIRTVVEQLPEPATQPSATPPATPDDEEDAEEEEADAPPPEKAGPKPHPKHDQSPKKPKHHGKPGRGHGR